MTTASRKIAVATALDVSAVALSTLCVIHCLALPVLVVLLPLTAVWFEYEWIHRLFVLSALLVSGCAVYASLRAREGYVFSAFVLLGLVLLTAGAFIESMSHLETPITVTGAMVLAAAHIGRWAQRRRHLRVCANNPSRPRRL